MRLLYNSLYKKQLLYNSNYNKAIGIQRYTAIAVRWLVVFSFLTTEPSGDYMYNKALIFPERPRGSRHYRALFNDAQVQEIRKAHQLGASYTHLAKAYNTRGDTIRNACLGYTYADVPGPRSRLGDKNNRFTREFIMEMKTAHHNGLSYKKLCKEYGVGMTTARKLLRS